MPKPASFADFPRELRCDYGPFEGVVDRLHDGDTLAIMHNPGFGHYPCEWIRLLGVKAPEMWEPGGKEMAAFVARECPPGTFCRVTTELTPESREQKTTLMRYVGTVELAGGRILNDMVNAEMERLGYKPKP